MIQKKKWKKHIEHSSDDLDDASYHDHIVAITETKVFIWKKPNSKIPPERSKDFKIYHKQTHTETYTESETHDIIYLLAIKQKPVIRF